MIVPTPSAHRSPQGSPPRCSAWALLLLAAGLAAALAACGGDQTPPAPEPGEDAPAPEASEKAPEPPEPEEEIAPEPEPEPEPLPQEFEYPVTSSGATLWEVVDDRLAADLQRSLDDEQVKTLIDRGVCGVRSGGGRLRHFYQLDGTPIPDVDPPSDRSPHRLRAGIDTVVCDRVLAEKILADEAP